MMNVKRDKDSIVVTGITAIDLEILRRVWEGRRGSVRSMNHTAKPDKIPWDKKTPDQRAKCVLDHLATEWATGNLRPKKQPKPQGPKP